MIVIEISIILTTCGQIYEKMILGADIVLIATPIRWGNSSSLYYKMIQRMNCVQNAHFNKQKKH